jgi:hypothetical protein
MRPRWILAPNDDNVDKQRHYQRASWSVENISIWYLYLARKSQLGENPRTNKSVFAKEVQCAGQKESVRHLVYYVNANC